jgi:hypothetical protein
VLLYPERVIGNVTTAVTAMPPKREAGTATAAPAKKLKVEDGEVPVTKGIASMAKYLQEYDKA